jgi:glycosyltransferase involved in cell wall biosynthesis
LKLLFVTQQVDPDDPVLGATVAKLRALAARVDELVVLSLAAVPGTLPANARVVTFGARSRLGRGIRFAIALRRDLHGTDAVLAHMCPIYAVLAAPLARPRRVPVLLWFAHWHRSALLRVAAALSTRVISVDRRSFPLESEKVVPIGHGIDYSSLPGRPPGAETEGPLRAVVLGRTSPAKGLETIVRAVALVPGIRLVVYGTSNSDEEERHRTELERLIVDLGLGERAAIREPVPRSEIGAVHAAADVLVNNMRAGAPDKAVYEACGSGLPVLVSNPSFDELFEGIPTPLRFSRDSPEELADRLRTLAALPAVERAAIGETLRKRVLERHSVETWAERVVTLVATR